MSQSFQAVKEIWNVHSSCFIEPEKLIVLLHDLGTLPQVSVSSYCSEKTATTVKSLKTLIHEADS